MPRTSSQYARARRALVADLHDDRRDWLQHGVAALAVSVLGLGVAGSVLTTGSAQVNTVISTPSVQTSVFPGVELPSEFDSHLEQASRSTARTALTKSQVEELAAQRASDLSQTEAAQTRTSARQAVQDRDTKLDAESAARVQNAARIKAEQLRAAREQRQQQEQREQQERAEQQEAGRAATPPQPSTSGEPADANRTADQATSQPRAAAGSGSASPPLGGAYTIAARFGQVGSWSRYHTGMDFAAPVGSPIQAPTGGVVTNAGSGPASWAGTYVTVRHANGTSSLYAHMSTVSVSVGQSVSGGQRLGAVGMTGRTFGPHLHFEVYPAGVAPGDVYRAVNPESWLGGLGLRA